MSHSQMEMEYPELKGLPHDAQLRILKNAKRGIRVWKHRLISTSVLGGALLIYVVILHYLPPLNVWIKYLGFGGMGGIYAFTDYRRINGKLRCKIRELIQNE